MSTELPDYRKLNVEPATTEELRARYNTEKTEDDSHEDYQEAYNRALEQEEVTTGNSSRASQIRKLALIAGGALGVGVAAMAGANAIGNASGDRTPTVTANPTNSGDALPTASASPDSTLNLPPASPSPSSTAALETQPAVEASNGIEIKTGLSNEQLGTVLIDRLSDWGMAGATKEVGDNRDIGANVTLSLEEYVDKVVNEKHAEFVAELLPSNYADDPALKQFADGMKKNMRTNTLRYLQTDGGPSLNPKNKEAWNSTATFEGVVKAETIDDSRSLVINFTEQNNADKNLFGNGVPTIPVKGKASFTVSEVNGSTLITSALLQSR